MVRKLMDNNRQPDTAVLSSASSTIKALWSQRQKLVIENDMMYRRWDNEKGVTLQAIVPLSERRKILSFCHDQPTSEHLRVRKTSSKVRQSYYWPGLQQDARHYISGCEKCQMSKNPIKTPRAPTRSWSFNGTNSNGYSRSITNDRMRQQIHISGIRLFHQVDRMLCYSKYGSQNCS